MLCIKIPEQFNRKDTPVIYSFIGKKVGLTDNFDVHFGIQQKILRLKADVDHPRSSLQQNVANWRLI